MSIVKVEGLNKTFADYRALDGVGFEFEHGILSILGPSGCGKTTLLRCIAGLEVPDDGAIWIDGKVQTDINKGILVPPYSREIGFVCLPKLGALYPSQPAGGRQRRAALARSLAREPRLILLDEPLSNLDAKLREEMRVELKKLIKKVGIRAIYVTHDQEEAFVISDYVIVMERGKILQYATPDEIYNWPAHQFVASFIGRSVLVEGQVVQAAGDEIKVSVPDFTRAVRVCRRPNGLAAGATCQLVIRTGEVKLSSRPFEQSENVLQGVMTSRDYRGGLTDHRVQIGSREIVVTSHKLCPMISVEGEGDKVFLYIDRSAISVIADHAGVSAQGAAH